MKKQLLRPALIVAILISLFVFTLDQTYFNNTESVSAVSQYCSVATQRELDNDKKAHFIEKRILKIYDHLWKSTVSVASGGTGVLVSKDGYIVTAGHVIESVRGKETSVTLYDGTTYDAVCLGIDDAGDYGLLKIKEKGNWDYAEMGASGSLAKDETCLMLGHSEGFRLDRPAVIRIGFYLGATNHGYLRTSCIMMPGDSGGPLFDLDGKVIGVCSYINEDLTGNYYPPIDKVKENWDKLTSGEVFNKRSRGSNAYERKIARQALSSKKPFVFEGGKTALIEVIGKEVQAEKANTSVVKVSSNIHGKETEIMGTIISRDGYIVSKSSEVGDDGLSCKFLGGEDVAAKIIDRDDTNDLVLIKVDKMDLDYIDIRKIVNIQPGQILGTIGYEGRVMHAGIVGVSVRFIPEERKIHNFGFMGVTFRGNTTAIESVANEGAAMVSGIVANDRVTMLNDNPVSTRKEVIDFLQLTKPGESVTVKLLRNEEGREIKIILGEAPPRSAFKSRHPAYTTIVSKRKADFASAFTHDMPLTLEECGSPVVSLEGHVVGINIARESRSCSFAIPLDVVAAVVDKMLNKTGV